MSRRKRLMAITREKGVIAKIYPLVTCPMCKGSARDLSLIHHVLVNCTLCNGKGWLPLVSCRGCGRPAFRWWPLNGPPLIQYCGLEVCFSRLVTIHRTDKSVGRPAIVHAMEEINRANQRVDQMDELKRRLQHRLGPACR